MKWTCRMPVFAVVCGLLMCSSASAQEGDTAGRIEGLQKAQQELKGELAGLKAELQELQAQLKQVTAALKTLQAQQKTPPKKPDRPALKLVGKPAPMHSFTTFDGKEMSIGGKRDKPQVLLCYASWCGYCRKALPWFESLHQQCKDKGVEVIAINLDARGDGKGARTEQQTLDQYRELNLTLPMTMTSATNDTKKIRADYKVRSFPTMFVLGPSGTIEAVHVGAKAGVEKTIATEVDLLMQGKTRADFPGT